MLTQGAHCFAGSTSLGVVLMCGAAFLFLSYYTSAASLALVARLLRLSTITLRENPCTRVACDGWGGEQARYVAKVVLH